MMDLEQFAKTPRITLFLDRRAHPRGCTAPTHNVESPEPQKRQAPSRTPEPIYMRLMEFVSWIQDEILYNRYRNVAIYIANCNTTCSGSYGGIRIEVFHHLTRK